MRVGNLDDDVGRLDRRDGEHARLQTELVRAVADQVKQPTRLGERLPPGGRDVVQGLSCLVQVRVQERLRDGAAITLTSSASAQ